PGLDTVADTPVVEIDVAGWSRQDPAIRHQDLVVGADESSFFILDAARARRQLARHPSEHTILRIPRAYELDDLTFGILWAVANPRRRPARRRLRSRRKPKGPARLRDSFRLRGQPRGRL